MIVYCCGMRRSGSTLQYNLVKELVESENLGKAVGWITDPEFSKCCADPASNNSIIVVKTHKYTNDKKNIIINEKGKAVYIYRDIRDVVVSVMHWQNKSFTRIIHSRFLKEILQDYYKWTSVEGILISRYENVIKDISKEVIRIAKYLKIRLNIKTANKIANKYSIKKQLKRIESFDYLNKGRIADNSIYNPMSLLHENHIWSGKPNQWKNSLPSFQIALIEMKAYGYLKKNNYQISQSWNNQRFALIVYLCTHWFFKGYYALLYLVNLTTKKLKNGKNFTNKCTR